MCVYSLKIFIEYLLWARRLRLRRAAVGELAKIIKSQTASSETKHTLALPMTMYRRRSCTEKKAERKRMDSSEIQGWRRAL